MSTAVSEMDLSQLPNRIKRVYDSFAGTSPFEVFRWFTNLPKQTAEKVGRMMCKDFANVDSTGEPIEVLDIGTGDSVFARHLTDNIAASCRDYKVHFSWLEPNQEYRQKLNDLSLELPVNFSADVLDDFWEDFVPDRQYDAIVLSHVHYNFPPEKMEEYISKMIQALKPNGRLYVVARDEDEDLGFIRKFYPLVHGRDPLPAYVSTINNVIAVVDTLKQTFAVDTHGFKIQTSRRLSRGSIIFPYARHDISSESIEERFEVMTGMSWESIPAGLRSVIIPFIQSEIELDMQQILTFYLNLDPDGGWLRVPDEIKNQIYEHVMEEPRNGQLKQIDGILVVTKRAVN